MTAHVIRATNDSLWVRFKEWGIRMLEHMDSPGLY